jgi:hypothetical protein
MGELLNVEGWRLKLSDEDVGALADEVEVEPYSLGHDRWFNLGRSGDPVAIAQYRPKVGGVKLRVVKFLHSDHKAKYHSMRDAWALSPPDFREHHLARLDDQYLATKSGRAVFLDVVGANLARYAPLSDLLDTDDGLPHKCGVIASSILEEWNKPTHRDMTIMLAGDLVNTIVGKRLDAVRTWVRDHPPRQDPSGVDPLDFLPEGQFAQVPVRNVLTGMTHGDLSGRNILIPAGAPRPSDSNLPLLQNPYVLIDYDHFSAQGLLARDLMHLVVALALDDFDTVAEPVHTALIPALVNPTVDTGHRTRPLRTIMNEVNAAGERYAETMAAGHVWHAQALACLIGVALVHIGRDL